MRRKDMGKGKGVPATPGQTEENASGSKSSGNSNSVGKTSQDVKNLSLNQNSPTMATTSSSSKPSNSGNAASSGNSKQAPTEARMQKERDEVHAERVARDKERNDKKEEDTKKREKWLHSEFDLEAFTLRGDDPQRQEVQANFLEVKHNSTPLRIYRINFPTVNGLDISNRERRRELIEALFLTHPPSNNKYASDYYEYVVSAGVEELYDNNRTLFSQLLHPADPTSATINTQLEYLRFIRTTELAAAVRHANRQDLPQDTDTTLDYRALNIISWRDIYNPTWLGVRAAQSSFRKPPP